MKASVPNPAEHLPDSAEIERWLSAAIASRLKLDHVDPERPLGEYGLDSMVAVRMLGKLEKWLNRPLPATLFFEYANIREMANALASGQVAQHEDYKAPDEDCY